MGGIINNTTMWMNSRNTSQKPRVYTISFHLSKFLVSLKLIYGERNENWLSFVASGQLGQIWNRHKRAIWDDGSAILMGVWVTQIIAFIKAD